MVRIKGGVVMKLTPLKAIRAKCLDCSNGSAKEVKLCTVTRCPLHEYRSGKTGRTKVMTDEQKTATAARLKQAREQKTASYLQ